MMLLVLLFGLLWIGLLAAVLLIYAILLVVAAIRRDQKLAVRSFGLTLAAMIGVTAAVTVAFIVAIAGLGYFWLRPYDPTAEADLQSAYEADFGVPPPSGIMVARARQVIIADSGVQWLLLEATPDEMDRHIARGFVPVGSPPPAFRGEAGGNAPEWWTPPKSGLEYYVHTNWSKSGGWSQSEAVMAIDRTAGTIWFEASKID